MPWSKLFIADIPCNYVRHIIEQSLLVHNLVMAVVLVV